MSTQGELNSPCAQVLFPNGHYSYAFGNTPAVELTEHFGTWKLEDTLNILFLGVGDIRNLLFTVSELCQRSEDAVPKRLCCHLNDFDLSVLARDVIILESVCSIDPCCDRDVDFLWNIWYNLALSRADSKRLQEMMKTLASRENAKGNVKFGSRTVFEECQEIWKDWLHQELNIEEATFQRRKVMLSGLNLLCPDVDSDVEHEQDTFATAASSLAVNTIKQLFTTTDETKLGVKCLQTSGSCYQEVFSYFLTGCTSRIHSDSELNPTLVRPFEHKWKVHYGSCPYDGYIPINRNLFEKFKSIAKSCKEILRSWVTHFQRYSPKITVTFWGGDALELCRDGLPRDLLFDVVDTSNLSDHVGLLNILVCCARRLKKPGESQLITSTMLWRSAGLTNLEDYLQSSLGIQQNTYPTILGLHFAEDLNLGKSDILSIKKSQRIEDRLVWVKTALERSPINLVRSPDILGALKSMADRCFKLPCHRSRSLQLCGASLSSPLTFFLAFRQVADIFQESAEQVLSYVEEALPTVRLFQKRSRFNICGLTWNVLKRLAGLLKGAIMKITVPVTFPSFPRITPVIQAVLFEDPADARFLSTWPVTQMKQRTFHRPVHLFYNNVHFDPAKGIATLFMLESDWEGLHMDTILLLISSSVSCTSGAVHLKRHCHFKEARGNMHVAFAKNGDDIEVRDTHARKSILRSKRRKSRDLARNLSCVRSVSCIVFNQKSKDLQKFDSSYGLDNLPMQDLNTGNSSNVHNSTDCLLSSENIVTHFYQTGISSPCFQLRAGAPVGTDVTDETLELESDCEAVTSAEPVDDNIQSFGSLDVTFMTLQPVKADHLELLVLEEHALCYNAEILIWRPFPKANHTVKYYPREMPTTVEISFGENRVPLKLSFSCPVDEKSCKVQVLEDRKQLRCHFRKSEFGVIGRACIKRPPIMDLSSLSTWSKKDDIRALISYATYEGEEVSEEKEAFMELQKTLCCIVASFLEKPEQDNCFYIVHSLETEEQTPNLTVVTQAVHCRKQAPLIKVLFCDHSLTAFSSEAVGNSTIVAKFKEVLIPRITKNQSSPMIQSTKQGQALLKRLLYSNAKRMIQPERLKPVWIQSFLQLRF